MEEYLDAYIPNKTRERMSPCCVCGYPVSESHHMAEQSRYGKNDITIRLCANCHELFHLLKSANNNPIRLGYIASQFFRGNAFGKKFNKVRELVEQSRRIDDEVNKRK